MKAVKYKFVLVDSLVLSHLEAYYFLKGEKDNQNYLKCVKLLIDGELSNERIAFLCNISISSLKVLKRDIFDFSKIILDNLDKFNTRIKEIYKK